MTATRQAGTTPQAGTERGQGPALGLSAGESVLRPDEPPIYAALVRRWQQSGRAVPGRLDEEWAALVAYVP